MLTVIRRINPCSAKRILFYSTASKNNGNTNTAEPKPSATDNNEFVEESNGYINTQEMFNELVYHPKKQLTESQRFLRSPNFEIPESLKGSEFRSPRSHSKETPSPYFDPAEQSLMKLLFGSAVKETGEKVARETRKLMDPDFDMDLKPLSDVAAKLANLEVKSNVLKLKLYDSLLIKSDFQRIFPNQLERQYDAEIDFEMVRGRYPDVLLSTGVIYLIFPDFLHAGCYYLETLNKQLNGQHLTFEFANLSEEYVFIQSPALENLKAPAYFELVERKEPDLTNLSDFIEQHKTNKKLGQAIGSSNGATSTATTRTTSESHTDDKLFNHTLLTEQSSKSKLWQRSQACFFKNLPKHITPAELEETLWDYNLYDLGAESIKVIAEGYWLVIFESQKDRDRCIRQFDNRHWYNNPKMPKVGVEAF